MDHILIIWTKLKYFKYRIDGHGVIKVADFGLTEDMYGTNYFRRDRSVMGSEDRVPIRWMAPESIENDIYNESTDVVRTYTMSHNSPVSTCTLNQRCYRVLCVYIVI